MLHQTIADYAHTQLHETSHLHRLVSYFVWFVQTHEKAYAELEQESENILLALEKAYEEGLYTEFVQGSVAFTHYLKSRGLYGLALLHLERANEVTHTNNDLPLKINVLLSLADILFPQGDYAQEEALLQEALTLARQIQDQEQCCACLTRLGSLYYERGDYVQAQTYLQEGQEIARQIQNQGRLCAFLNNLSLVEWGQGNYSQAESYLQEGLLLARQLHDQERENAALINLGAIASEQGHWTRAESYCQEALVLTRQLGHREFHSILLVNLCKVAMEQGHLTQAEAYGQEGIALARQSAQHVMLLYLLANMGSIATERGNYIQAEAYLHEGIAAASRIGHPRAMGILLLAKGELRLKQHQLEDAMVAFYETENHIPQGQQDLQARAWYGLARVAYEQGKVEEARRLGKASVDIFEQLGHKMLDEVHEWLYNTVR